MDFETINGWPLAIIIIVAMIFGFLTHGKPDVIDAVICNLMDSCADWQAAGDDQS